MLRLLGNVLWFVLAGVWLAISFAVAGLVMFVLIVTIPFGIASFRLAGFALWPFGRTTVPKPSAGAASAIGNVLWFLLAGIWIALECLVVGLILCVTIVGIPFGLQCFKIAGLAFFPFGADIVGTPHGLARGALGLVLNVLWCLVAGLWIFLSHVVLAVGLAVTIIGIPFAWQHAKLAILALAPFGQRVV